MPSKKTKKVKDHSLEVGKSARDQILEALEGDRTVPKPATRNDVLRTMGMNAKAIQRLANLERVVQLKDIDKQDRKDTMELKLDTLALEGAQCEDITACRRSCAELLNCARPMLEECDYLLDNPDGLTFEDFDREDTLGLQTELQNLCRELEARAGYPQPYKSAKAEAMRTKLEKRLVPALREQIPKWADQLRFARAKVLRWRLPSALVPEKMPHKEPERIMDEIPEWEAPKDWNPKPRTDDGELELLQALGWTPPPDGW